MQKKYLMLATLFTCRTRNISNSTPCINNKGKPLRWRTDPQPRRIIPNNNQQNSINSIILHNDHQFKQNYKQKMSFHPLRRRSSWRAIRAFGRGESAFCNCLRAISSPENDVVLDELLGEGKRGKNIVWRILPECGGRRIIAVGSFSTADTINGNTKINTIAGAIIVRSQICFVFVRKVRFPAMRLTVTVSNSYWEQVVHLNFPTRILTGSG